MNLRTVIIKGLYPMCSKEVQILIDQMQRHPEKFAPLFESTPYSIGVATTWHSVLGKGRFELVDGITIRQQLILLKVARSKEMILEGLLGAEPAQVHYTDSGFGLAHLKQEGTSILNSQALANHIANHAAKKSGAGGLKLSAGAGSKLNK